MTNATILTNTMPTEGQFIAVWKHAGDTWSRTFRHVKDGVEQYDYEADDWDSIGMPFEEMVEDVEMVGYLGVA